MADALNPYESPRDATFLDDAGRGTSREVDWLAVWSWPAVFAANAFVPTLLGLGLLRNNVGLTGLVLGCALMLAIGWLVCLRRPKIIRTTIAGACVLMISQLFPVFQMMAGSISIAAAGKVGLPTLGGRDDDLPRISSELAALFVTVSTAAIHIGAAFAIGLFVNWILTKQQSKRIPQVRSLS